MSPPPEIEDFMVAAQAAMTEIMRARVQSGIAAGDPLNPLIVALANIIAVLGKMPAAVARQQRAITTASQAMADAAQAELRASLAETTKDLVNSLGGAVRAKEKWKWMALTGVVLGLVAFGSEWMGQSWAVKSANALAQVKIDQIIADTAKELSLAKAEAEAEIASVKALTPGLPAWAKTILPVSNTGAADPPYPCVGWGDQVYYVKLGNGPRRDVVSCVIALRYRTKEVK